jgi:hypothetical protein
MSTGSVVAATGYGRELGRWNSALLQTSVTFGVACFAIVLFALVPATTRIAGAQLSGISIGLGSRLIKSTIRGWQPGIQKPGNFAPACRSG